MKRQVDGEVMQVILSRQLDFQSLHVIIFISCQFREERPLDALSFTATGCCSTW